MPQFPVKWDKNSYIYNHWLFSGLNVCVYMCVCVRVLVTL